MRAGEILLALVNLALCAFALYLNPGFSFPSARGAAAGAAL